MSPSNTKHFYAKYLHEIHITPVLLHVAANSTEISWLASKWTKSAKKAVVTETVPRALTPSGMNQPPEFQDVFHK